MEIVAERSGHSHRSLLGRMMKLAVASTLSHLMPTVCVQLIDDLPHFHCDPTVGRARFATPEFDD